MISVRKAKDRGHVNIGWLNAKHTFSFGSYFDPAHMSFRSLRVINNDLIAPAGGFDTHPHKDMEIMTFILEGELEHRDTIGNHSIIKPGEIQIMSAGTGVYHSEHNPSDSNSTKLYQIWITPNQSGVEPRYEQYDYLHRVKTNDIIDLVTPEGGDQIPMIYQDASIKFGKFESGVNKSIDLDSNKGYWVQVIKGELEVEGSVLESEDGLSIEKQNSITFDFTNDTEFLLFELG